MTIGKLGLVWHGPAHLTHFGYSLWFYEKEGSR